MLDDLGSREAVLVAVDGAFATAALFAATHPSRTAALVVLQDYADPSAIAGLEGAIAAVVAMWGTGSSQPVLNPDTPWNEEIRAAWARMERLAPDSVGGLFYLAIFGAILGIGLGVAMFRGVWRSRDRR